MVHVTIVLTVFDIYDGVELQDPNGIPVSPSAFCTG